MRVLRFSLGGLALLLVGLFVAAAVVLPRLVESDAVRDRLQEAGRKALGRDVAYERLAFGWLPPRVRVLGARISGPTAEAPSFLTADSVDLRLELLPLLSRTLVVESLQLDGASLHLTRTEDGFDLPGFGDAPAARSAPVAAASSDDESGFTLAARELVLRGGRLEIIDRTVDPTVAWQLEDLEASAHARSLGTPIDFEAEHSLGMPIDFEVEGRLASGGTLHAEGAARLDGGIDARLELRSFAMSALAPYLDGEADLAGKLSGTLRTVDGDAGLRLAADLVLEEASISIEEFGLAGRVRLKAELQGDLDAPTGHFEIDATEAELDYAGAFTKPVGTPASISGRLVPVEGGRIGAQDLRVRIKNIDTEGSLRWDDGVSGSLRFPAFGLGGWETLLPSLHQPVAGRLGPASLEFATRPFRIDGESALEGVTLHTERGALVVLNGALEFEGETVRTRDLVARIAGEPVETQARVVGYASAEPRFDLKIATRGADSKVLLSAFSSMEDLEGPLDLDADLTGPLTGEGSLASRVRGSARFRIGPGRLRGVSLLSRALAGLRGTRAADLGERAGEAAGRSLDEDAFDALFGTIDLANGVASTHDLRIVYPDYKVDLRGTVGIEDRRLDLVGDLIVEGELARAFGSAHGRERVIPLAHVRGTIEDPRVAVAPETVLALASGTLTERREKLERKIDERLGEGTGAALLDALEGFLAGRGSDGSDDSEASER